MPQAVRAADFLDTLGVGTKFSQGNQYADTAKAVAALEYLGIDHIREGYVGADKSTPLVAAGAKIDLVVYPNLSPAQNVANLKAMVERHPGAVVSIEGPNEVDLWPVSYGGKTGVQGAQAWQAELFRLVNADPMLRDIPVFNFTWGVGPADKPGDADWANVHAYRPNGNQPINGMKWHLDYQQNVMPGKPMALTETGYYTLPNDDNWGGVDGRSQAAMTLNTFFRADAFGVDRTFLYQMLDQYNDGRGREAHFGLFNYDFSPKPAADAIHNLTTILGDRSANAETFAAGSLNYTVSGLPSHGGHKLMQESDGTFDLAVWAEPDIWDEGANRAITAPNTPVTVNLGQSFASVKVYDPLRGTGPVSTYSNVSSVRLDVTDHPLIVELSSGGTAPAPAPSPTPTPTPPPSPSPTTLTVGSGADSLVLRVSQDAYQGDAQYTVSVDGVQIGGTLTAKALHSQGASDTVTVKGNWAAGSHNVAVTFLNDAWGGTAAADRNLHLDSAAYNGVALSGATADLMSAGSASFSFVDAATPPTSGAAASLSAGSGPDTLVLRVSQDAYQGSAQYTVAVDGKQIGGTFTASAAHASGQADTLTLKGDWAAGAHTVSVTFLNDAYGGTAATDRNLHLDGATYNGVAVANVATMLGDSGSASFSFTEAATAPPPPANQTLRGTGNADALTGAGGADRLTGLAGNDTLVGAAGNDVLKGGAGTDTLDGGTGNDWLVGGSGADVLTGGAGADRFVVQTADDGADTIRDFRVADGDRLDLHSVLGAFGDRYAPLSAGGFVKLTAVAGGVQVAVDEDGGGNQYFTLATLTGSTVAGLGTDFLVA